MLAAPLDPGAFVRIVASDHVHALRSVVDGIHVDLILAHESPTHPGESEPHLHARRAEDHVVHLARGDLGLAQRNGSIDSSALPPRIASPAVLWIAPEAAERFSARPLTRPTRSFSRRSVVLRT